MNVCIIRISIILNNHIKDNTVEENPPDIKEKTNNCVYVQMI